MTDTDCLTFTGVLERVRATAPDPYDPDELTGDDVEDEPDSGELGVPATPPRRALSGALAVLQRLAAGLYRGGQSGLAWVAGTVAGVIELTRRRGAAIRAGLPWTVRSRGRAARHRVLAGPSTLQRNARLAATYARRRARETRRQTLARVTEARTVAEAELVEFWARVMDTERPGHTAFISHHAGV